MRLEWPAGDRFGPSLRAGLRKPGGPDLPRQT